MKAALITVVTFPYKKSAIYFGKGWRAVGFLILFNCFAVMAAAAVTLPEGPGKATVEKMCGRCHSLDVAAAVSRSREEWQAVVDNMVQRGATGSPEEIRQVVDYLAAQFGKKGASGVVSVATRINPPLKTFASQRIDPNTMDWSAFGRDAGATRYSPLTQINTQNVSKLVRAWTYDTAQRGKPFEVTPIVRNGVLYLMTPAQHVLALQPESGHELWHYDPHSSRGAVGRGVSYWPGDPTHPARIVFGTNDARLIALDAMTGKPAPDFGDNGIVNLRPAILERFPKAPYAITSPPAIYRDLVIVGPNIQEGPSKGPPGEARAFDVKSGKLVWTFHALPPPGQPGNETWGPNGGKDRAGPSVWGFATVDQATGLIFLPIGNPADSFYGADRPGENLYSNSIVALSAATGEHRWHFQMVHHDIFDNDVAGPPTLITVRKDGTEIPAVAEVTKSGLLFILDRMNGRPIFGVEERKVWASDVPGEKSWPTQPFPLKPPPLARNTVSATDLASLSPESARFCADLLNKYPNHGPYTPMLMNGSTVFPSTMGGGNWGGVSFDATLHLIFVATSGIGSIGKMIKAPEGAPIDGIGGMPYRSEGGYARFVDQNHYPCNKPPWGELTAVNADTGDIAWRVPLGSYPELEARGIKNTGAPALGGSVVTAGHILFIGATNDSQFRAFDSRNGQQLWSTKIDAPAETSPITFLGRDGKQYVVIASGSAGHLRSIGNDADDMDVLTAFALPD